MKYPWEIDVAVLCIFFARPMQFAKTFEKVKRARPRILLLYQDGPRDNRPDDMENISKCRKIVEDIDWDCEVHTWYQTENYGCDPSTFMAHKWAFSIVDKCIILEDDFVVADSFFLFCKKLLDKYEYDTRINRICGANTLGILENCPYDYFFSSTGVGGIWATWKRVADTWDENYTFLKDEYYIKELEKLYKGKGIKKYLNLAIDHKNTGKAHWETIVSFSQLLNSRLNIIVTRNMVDNIGIDENSTHTIADIRQMPKAMRMLYNIPVFELSEEIKHPPYVVENREFVERYARLLGNGYPWIQFYRKMESVFLKIRYGNGKSVINGIKRRFLKRN